MEIKYTPSPFFADVRLDLYGVVYVQEPTVALGDFSAGGCGCVKPLLDATILTMIRGGAFKTV